MWERSAKNGRVGRCFLLYAAVSKVVLHDVERLAYTQIHMYTAIDHVNGN